MCNQTDRKTDRQTDRLIEADKEIDGQTLRGTLTRNLLHFENKCRKRDIDASGPALKTF